jgi:hypothetical protein
LTKSSRTEPNWHHWPRQEVDWRGQPRCVSHWKCEAQRNRSADGEGDPLWMIRATLRTVAICEPLASKVVVDRLGREAEGHSKSFAQWNRTTWEICRPETLTGRHTSSQSLSRTTQTDSLAGGTMGYSMLAKSRQTYARTAPPPKVPEAFSQEQSCAPECVSTPCPHGAPMPAQHVADKPVRNRGGPAGWTRASHVLVACCSHDGHKLAAVLFGRSCRAQRRLPHHRRQQGHLQIRLALRTQPASAGHVVQQHWMTRSCKSQ